jgi:hypothetical protein
VKKLASASALKELSIAAWCWYPALNIPNNKQGTKAMITIFMVRFKSSAALI